MLCWNLLFGITFTCASHMLHYNTMTARCVCWYVCTNVDLMWAQYYQVPGAVRVIVGGWPGRIQALHFVIFFLAQCLQGPAIHRCGGALHAVQGLLLQLTSRHGLLRLTCACAFFCITECVLVVAHDEM